jgi:hypothetical protein
VPGIGGAKGANHEAFEPVQSRSRVVARVVHVAPTAPGGVALGRDMDGVRSLMFKQGFHRKKLQIKTIQITINHRNNMKQKKDYSAMLMTGLLTLLVAFTVNIQPNRAFASGGSGSGGSGNGSSSGGGGSTSQVDTIKVNKCYYADVGAYVELLLNAVSSNSSAHLYAYLPDGTYLGEVQNGGGGQYGGTVFVTMRIPASITFVSSVGGSITVPTEPFQFETSKFLK